MPTQCWNPTLHTDETLFTLVRRHLDSADAAPRHQATAHLNAARRLVELMGGRGEYMRLLRSR